MTTWDFVKKEMWNNGYAAGFKAGLEHAEKTIKDIESRIYDDLKACGMKNTNPRATPLLAQIIKEMYE